jgi:hypothetical protein
MPFFLLKCRRIPVMSTTRHRTVNVIVEFFVDLDNKNTSPTSYNFVRQYHDQPVNICFELDTR